MSEKKLIKATHQGSLKIGDKELPCAVLENGARVLTSSAVFKAFNRPSRGRRNIRDRTDMPSFMDAKNLQPFIDKELTSLTHQIEYLTKNNKLATGYVAEAIPLICDVYLSARNARVLTVRQLPLANAAEILVRSLSKIGIIALVDEATGYQADRDKDELQKFLSLYLSEERLKWAKMFPDEYYRQLFRLRGWTYSPLSVKRPKLVGRLTNELVYKKLPANALEELRRLNPVKNKKTWRREATHFQHLSEDIGQPDLRGHLMQLIAIMKISPNWAIFKRHFARLFPPDIQQIEFAEFDEID